MKIVYWQSVEQTRRLRAFLARLAPPDFGHVPEAT